MLSWNNITVQQFLDIHKLHANKEQDAIEKTETLVALLFNLSEKEVGELTVKDFNAKAKECDALMSTDIPGKPVKRIRVGKNVYKIVYGVDKWLWRQYLEVTHFGDKPVENMHLIMASLVQPVKWGIARKNRAEDHAQVAADLLNAPVAHIYHTALFFCKLYINSMQAIKGYLVGALMKTKKIAREEAEAVVSISVDGMAGFILPRK